MKNFTLTLLGAFLLLQSCTGDDLATDEFAKSKNGAYLRTVGFENAAFVNQDPSSTFEVSLDMFDQKRGDYFKRVDIYISYEDYSPENGDQSSPEIMLDQLFPDDFSRTSSELPRINLKYSLAEAATALDIPITGLTCNDEFVVRLDIVLEDDRSFSVGQNSSSIIYFESFSRSPFRYRIPVIEPIDNDRFTGDYLFRSIEGFPFVFEGIVTIEKTHTPNFRRVRIPPAIIEFRVLCDEIRITEYLAACYQCDHIGAPPLFGPGIENAPINPLDDSAFEIWMDLGYEGYGPFLPTKIQLIKQ